MSNNRFLNNPITSGDAAVWQKTADPSILFRAFLTDNGTDYTLNEDYSSSNAVATYYTASEPVAVQSMTIQLCNGDIAQSTVKNYEVWCGDNAALTNGIKFRVVNSGGTVLLDISNTVGLKTEGEMLTLATNMYENYSAASATTGNNTHYINYEVNFEQKFGKAIRLNTGDQFVAYLSDDLSGNVFFQIQLWGYKL